MNSSGTKRPANKIPANKTPPGAPRTIRPASSGTTSQRSKRKRCSRPRTTSSSDEDLPMAVDERTEAGLRSSAARNNLTPAIVKNILKKVCHNDHVLALVRLKEEEQNRCAERAQNAVDASTNTEDVAETPTDDCANIDLGCTLEFSASAWSLFNSTGGSEALNASAYLLDENGRPLEAQRSPFKLTRAKARALNKKPLPILPLPPTAVHPPAPEMAAIITAELGSDEEEDDEEYQPGEDDVLSDDEFHITFSDLESQPATPASTCSFASPRPCSAISMVKYSSDGNFKIPTRSNSRADNRMATNNLTTDDRRIAEADYIIAQQTRSKVSLAATPIEIIEANFQPPDVDNSAVAGSVNCSITSEYLQFLTDTISDKPICVEEDDADDDEDFQLPNFNTPFADREEMYNRPIPQQECQDLFDDLLNFIDNTNMNSHPELQSLIRQLDGPTTSNTTTNASSPTNIAAYQATAEAEAAATLATPSQPPRPTRWCTWKTHYAARLYRHLATEPPPVDYEFPANGGFLDFQLQLLQQQLRQHVQLATQTFLQTYGHPGNDFWKYADLFKGFLTDTRDQLSWTDADDFGVVNLRPALELVDNWEADRSVNNRENTAFVRYMNHHTARSHQQADKVRSHFFFFHPLVSDAMLTTRSVFLYVHLLPACPLRLDLSGVGDSFLPHDDFLIALGLERIYRELREAERTITRRRRGKRPDVDVSLNNVCKRVAAEMVPWRGRFSNAVYKYVVRRRNLKEEVINPIQYYFKHNKAPTIKHTLHPFGVLDLIPIGDRSPDMLSKEWKAAVDKLKNTANETNLSLSTCRTSVADKTLSPSKLQVTCVNCAHISTLDTSLLLDADTEQISTQTIQSVAGPIVVTTIVCSQLDEEEYTWPSPPPLRSEPAPPSPPPAIREFQHSQAARVLAQVLGRFVHPIHGELQQLGQHHPLLAAIFAALVSLDVYANLCRLNTAMSSTETATTCFVTDIPEKRTTNMAAVDVVQPEQAAPEAASAAPPVTTSQQGTTKKAHAQWKTPAAGTYRVLIASESAADVDERDKQFAGNFLERIREAYAAHPGDNRYTQILGILNSFDPQTESATALYSRCESLFLPDHPELAEMFLAFLLPSDAAQLGRFIEHNICESMQQFVTKLYAYFARQPTQLRRILGAIRDLAEETDAAALTVERVRAKIVPMLRGNPLLIEWFLQCFASDSMGGGSGQDTTAYETVTVPKSGADYFASMATTADAAEDAADAYEEIAAADLVADPPEHPCNIRFMNGHIFYGGKIVLPVQLAFQTVQYSLVVPAASADEEQAEDDASPVTTSYECVHEIKRVGEKKLDTLFAAPEDVQADAVAEAAANDFSGDQAAPMATEEMANVGDAQQTPAQNNADKCCSEVLLRAHAVRLNPTVHGSQLRKPSDMLELLKKNPAGTAASAGSERFGSPKKRAANDAAYAANAASSSPPAKKCKLRRQKTVRKTTPPKTATPATPSTPPAAAMSVHCPSIHSDDPDEEDMMAPNVSIEATASAEAKFPESCLVTPKEEDVGSNASTGADYVLKTSASSTPAHFDDPDDADIPQSVTTQADDIPTTPFQDADDEDAVYEDMELDDTEDAVGNDANLKTSAEESDMDDDYDDSAATAANAEFHEESDESDTANETKPGGDWQRTEDKIVLEEIKIGFETEEELVQRLLGMLPNRSEAQIAERYAFLMDVIANL